MIFKKIMVGTMAALLLASTIAVAQQKSKSKSKPKSKSTVKRVEATKAPKSSRASDAVRTAKSSKTTRKTTKSSASKSEKQVNKPGSNRSKTRRRLPRYFGKLKLEDSQRQEIYSVQDEYALQIAKLMDQLDELRSERDTKIEGILTEDQKTEYSKLIVKTTTRSTSRSRKSK